MVYHVGDSHILKISKSVTLLVKMKNVSFILWKKLNGLFGQPNNFFLLAFTKKFCLSLIAVCLMVIFIPSDKGACGLPRRLFTGFIEFLLLHKDRCLGPSVLLILGMEG